MSTPEPELLPTPPPSPSSSPPRVPPQYHHGMVLSPPALPYPMAMFPSPPPPPPPSYQLPGPYMLPPMPMRILMLILIIKLLGQLPFLGCFSDLDNCCMTCVCPCLTFGHIAEIINEGRTPWYETGLTYLLLALPGWILGFGFICNASFPYTFLHRLRMRNKFKIEGNLLSDCAAHAFCQYCAMSQEFRELGHRGFEVPLGWNGNMDMHMRAAAVYQFTPPDVEQEMTR